jgi:CDP-glucose 4,6-dehydratase
VLERLAEHWPGGIEWTHDDGPHPHEAPALRLDSTRAAERLDWRPAVALEPALAGTVAWFRALEQGEDMRAVTLAQLDDLRSPSLA